MARVQTQTIAIRVIPPQAVPLRQSRDRASAESADAQLALALPCRKGETLCMNTEWSMNSGVTVDVVRVFTDKDGGFGNELGLVDSSDHTRGREQLIAAALGFSETVFVDEVSEGRAHIRIFTPAGELPFAGHPSVGVAWWFARRGVAVTVLVEKAGDVSVRYDEQFTWISGRAQWAPTFEWIELPDVAALDALDPASFTTGMNYAYCWMDEAGGVVRSRMFGPQHNIVEDEATGAAAVAVTTRLGRDLRIHQGRGSEIVTRQGLDGVVHIGGRTVFDRSLPLPIE